MSDSERVKYLLATTDVTSYLSRIEELLGDLDNDTLKFIASLGFQANTILISREEIHDI